MMRLLFAHVSIIMNKKTTYKLSPDMIPAVIVYPGEILLDEKMPGKLSRKSLLLPWVSLLM